MSIMIGYKSIPAIKHRVRITTVWTAAGAKSSIVSEQHVGGCSWKNNAGYWKIYFKHNSFQCFLHDRSAQSWTNQLINNFWKSFRVPLVLCLHLICYNIMISLHALPVALFVNSMQRHCRDCAPHWPPMAREIYHPESQAFIWSTILI